MCLVTAVHPTRRRLMASAFVDRHVRTYGTFHVRRVSISVSYSSFESCRECVHAWFRKRDDKYKSDLRIATYRNAMYHPMYRWSLDKNIVSRWEEAKEIERVVYFYASSNCNNYSERENSEIIHEWDKHSSARKIIVSCSNKCSIFFSSIYSTLFAIFYYIRF